MYTYIRHMHTRSTRDLRNQFLRMRRKKFGNSNRYDIPHFSCIYTGRKID